MIAVAHRLATIQNADIIFVLGEGSRLLEKGSHSELLRERGVYHHMVRLGIPSFHLSCVEMVSLTEIIVPKSGP